MPVMPVIDLKSIENSAAALTFVIKAQTVNNSKIGLRV